MSVERVLDIYPTLGQITDYPSTKIPLGASPDMLNMCVYRGTLRKRPGYSQFPAAHAAFASGVVGLASMQDEDNGTHLFAMHTTGVKKYNTGTSTWDDGVGPALTGSLERLFSWEVSQNSMVFSQGVDAVQRFPFSGLNYAVLNANCPPARYLTRAVDRLVLAYTVETGATKPFRVRRSIAADHTNWVGTGSGFTDLSEFPYHLRGIRKFGSRLIAYTEKSVLVGTRTGQAAAPLAWDPVLTESGLYAPYTLKGKKNTHIFVGNDDVYEFDGAQVHPRMLGKVRGEVYGSLNSGSLHRMFAEVLTDTQEYISFLCLGGVSTPNYAWVYNWGWDIWYPWSVSGPMCSTIHRVDNTQTWDGLSGTWDSYPYEWDSFALQSAVPALLTGHSDGKVYKWGFDLLSDNGSAFLSRWTSKDFVSEDVDEALRGRQVEIKDILFLVEPQGTAWSFTVAFSTDRGATWLIEETVNVGANATEARLDKQVTGDQVRFRLSQQSTTQNLIIQCIKPRVEAKGAKVS